MASSNELFDSASNPAKRYLVNPEMSTGAIETIKWLAIIFMFLDHINRAFFDIDWMYNLGRIAFPLFALMFAYNMARLDSKDHGTHVRAIKRLVLFGAIAQLPYLFVTGNLPYTEESPMPPLLPLNVLFLFAVAAGIFYTLDLSLFANKLKKLGATSLAILIFILFGSLVEFFYIGLAICIVAFHYFRTPNLIKGSLIFFLVSLLVLVNENNYALLALPIFILVSHLKLSWVSRSKWWVFYGFYPVHLAVLGGIKLVI